MKRAIIIIILSGLLGCPSIEESILLIETPGEIRKKAWEEAEQYIGMEYEWGGQDFYDRKGIDCSGLIVNCYRAAVTGTGYEVTFEDASVSDLLFSYTKQVDTPEIGDVIFMGEEDITHIAIFEKIEDNQVYFIDAYSVSGVVERRNYALDHHKIKRFGRILVKKIYP
ncbi:hypothetical protein ES703_33040 [subsurface metagenome]